MTGSQSWDYDPRRDRETVECARKYVETHDKKIISELTSWAASLRSLRSWKSSKGPDLDLPRYVIIFPTIRSVGVGFS